MMTMTMMMIIHKRCISPTPPPYKRMFLCNHAQKSLPCIVCVDDNNFPIPCIHAAWNPPFFPARRAVKSLKKLFFPSCKKFFISILAFFPSPPFFFYLCVEKRNGCNKCEFSSNFHFSTRILFFCVCHIYKCMSNISCWCGADFERISHVNDLFWMWRFLRATSLMK